VLATLATSGNKKKTLVAHVSPQWNLTKMGSYQAPILSTPICFFNNGMVFVGKHGRLSTME